MIYKFILCNAIEYNRIEYIIYEAWYIMYVEIVEEKTKIKLAKKLFSLQLLI